MRSRCASITGATGFLGRRIAETFRDAGWTVRAVVRPGSRKPLPSGVERHDAALLDSNELVRAFDGAAVVVHCAGVVRAPHDAAFDVANVAGTRAVVAAVNATGSRLVHISSLAAIGPGTPERPACEDDLPQPVNAYGRSKLGGELAVRELARVPWIILRPSAIYGPGDRGFLPLVQMARHGLFPMATRPSMPFTFVFVEDVATAVLRAGESAVHGEACFVGHRIPETAGAMLQVIAAALSRPFRPLPVPRSFVRVAGRFGDLVWSCGGTPLLDSSRVAEFAAPGFVCDVTRATTLLEFTATVDLADGMRRTVQWYRDEGWI